MPMKDFRRCISWNVCNRGQKKTKPNTIRGQKEQDLRISLGQPDTFEQHKCDSDGIDHFHESVDMSRLPKI